MAGGMALKARASAMNIGQVQASGLQSRSSQLDLPPKFYSITDCPMRSTDEKLNGEMT